MRVPYFMASEFCEMVTPCGNGPAKMGSLASVNSAQENAEIFNMVASFSQDNAMENEVWLGWNTQNPHFWEDGSPAFPNGFQAFAPPGAPARGWPVTPQRPFAPPPGSGPVMKRQSMPGRGPEWDLVEATAMRAFVCEVAAGQNIPAGQQPGMGGQQPGMGGQQPGMGGQQPGMGGQRPGMGGQRPGMGGQQPGQRPGMGGNPNPRFNRPRMLQDNDVVA